MSAYSGTGKAELPASNLQIAKGISLIEEMRRESMLIELSGREPEGERDETMPNVR